MKYSMFTGFMRNADDHGIEWAADYARDCGFSGVEFFYMACRDYEIPDTETAKKYKEIVTNRGLSIPCVSVGTSLVRSDNPKAIAKLDLDGALKALDFTAALGTKLFHHTLIMAVENHKLTGLEYDEIYPLVLEGASVIANRAAELGITVLYEPQGKFFNGREGLGKFYAEMKKSHQNLGICCDLGNSFWVGEEPYGFFEDYKEDIKHVHLKDYLITDEPIDKSHLDLKGGKYISEAVIGEGVVDLKRITAMLRSVGYDGFMSLEDYVNIQSPELIKSIMTRVDNLFN